MTTKMKEATETTTPYSYAYLTDDMMDLLRVNNFPPLNSSSRGALAHLPAAISSLNPVKLYSVVKDFNNGREESTDPVGLLNAHSCVLPVNPARPVTIGTYSCLLDVLSSSPHKFALFRREDVQAIASKDLDSPMTVLVLMTLAKNPELMESFLECFDGNPFYPLETVPAKFMTRLEFLKTHECSMKLLVKKEAEAEESQRQEKKEKAEKKKKTRLAWLLLDVCEGALSRLRPTSTSASESASASMPGPCLITITTQHLSPSSPGGDGGSDARGDEKEGGTDAGEASTSAASSSSSFGREEPGGGAGGASGSKDENGGEGKEGAQEQVGT